MSSAETRKQVQERSSQAEVARRNRIDDEIRAANEVEKIGIQFLDAFFERKEAEIFGAFKAASPGDKETLSKIHYLSKAMESLRAEVKSALNTGKMAAKEKESLQ